MNASQDVSIPLGEVAPLVRPSRRPRVLVAEDDEELRTLIAQVLMSDGYDVLEVSDGTELLRFLARYLVAERDEDVLDLVVTDVRMPGWSGLEVLAGVRTAGCTVPFIVITAFGDVATHMQARTLNAAAVFDKPFEMEDLRTAVQVFAPSAGVGWAAPDPSSRLRVLVAEEDDDVRNALAISLRADGHEVVEAESGAELIEHLSGTVTGSRRDRPRFDLVVSAIGRPGWPGVDGYAALRQTGWSVPLILLCDGALRGEVEGSGRIDRALLLAKPVHVLDLLTVLYNFSLWTESGFEGRGHTP